MASCDIILVPAESLGLAVLETDGKGMVIAATSAAAALWGTSPDGLTGRRVATLLSDPDVLKRAMADGSGSATARVELLGAEAGPQDIAVAPIEDTPDGGQRFAVVLHPAHDPGQREAERRELERLQLQLADAEAGRRKAERVRRELVDVDGAPEIVGRSAPMLAMLEQIDRVAPVDSTVLIFGETGSGKELVARRIHGESARASAPMVAVNCAAMPDTLIESELFGHERGAFTGADRQRLGKFELADGGTLFLDEVAELSLAAQAKLLRVLQNGTFERVGGTRPVRVDVRVVAATHRDLAQQVRRSRFREDLFYRLSVFRIDVPALRDRRDDIRPLVEFLHTRHAQRMGRGTLPITPRSLRRLMAYRWPGNVRELENAVERATLLADPLAQRELDIELPTGGGTSSPLSSGSSGANQNAAPRDVLLDLTHDQLQRLQIMHALETANYRVYGEGGAAGKLDLKPQTLLSRMDKLGIPRPRAARGAKQRQRSTPPDTR